MLNLNNNGAQLKKNILVELIKLQLEGKLTEEIDSLPEKLIPSDSPSVYDSVETDRKNVRHRILARMGFSLETADLSKKLSSFAEEALKREKPDWPLITVVKDSCNACVKSRYFPTDACQGCLARPCKVNCPKQAIEITDHRAVIDYEKCISCGMCLQNCPYHAIIKTTVPCEEHCPVGAISKDADGRESIDFEKCIFCGKCMSNCPFSAVMDKSQLLDVVRKIQEGKKVVAMYAPAIGAQFKGAKPGQLEGAMLQAGFSKVMEVAIGADITADKEAKEFEERMEKGEKLMTTSCCPAYVRAAKLHIPEIVPCISDTLSPMMYTAQVARKADPECITVFVGPCLAKRNEAFDSELVDYVLTVEEVNALFEAKGINVTQAEAVLPKYTPTVSGRNFAKTAGVAESVKLRLHDVSILRPLVINGLTKDSVKTIKNYGLYNEGKGACPAENANLIEVMCCEGGCIAGPGVISNPKLGQGLLTIYANGGSKPGADGKPAACDVEKRIEEEK